MAVFLKLKHWQLFLLTWGFPLLLNFFVFIMPGLVIKLFLVMMIFLVTGTFGWIWAISTKLHAKLPAGVKLNLVRFRIFFFIPIVYILGIIVLLGYMVYMGPLEKGSVTGVFVGLIVLLHLFSMVGIFLGMGFAARTLKSVELGRLAKFEDYSGEFFLIWFSVVGIWVLQPRLNKLIESQHTSINIG